VEKRFDNIRLLYLHAITHQIKGLWSSLRRDRPRAKPEWMPLWSWLKRPEMCPRRTSRLTLGVQAW
jgi:hypothetical protein